MSPVTRVILGQDKRGVGGSSSSTRVDTGSGAQAPEPTAGAFTAVDLQVRLQGPEGAMLATCNPDEDLEILQAAVMRLTKKYKVKCISQIIDGEPTIIYVIQGAIRLDSGLPVACEILK